MTKCFNVLFVLAIFCSIVSYDSFAEAVAENDGFTLQVKDKLINLQAENAGFKEILKKLEEKTGIKVKIYEGVKDKKVSLNIKSLPVYAVGTILDKMLLNNFAVVYDDQLASLAVYVLPEGKDISEVTKGKTIIRHEEFASGKTINTIKNRKIASITKGKNKVPIRYVKDEVLLKFNLGVSKQEIQEILKKHNLVEVSDGALSKIGYIKVKIPDDRDVINVIKEIRKEYKLKIPEPNYITSILTVSDPLYSDQWYIPDTNFDKAWEKTQSKDSIKIALIDSGVDAGHPDLNEKILNGFDFVNDDTDASDDHGHGTFVAGIISATANDIGIKGLYSNAQIIPIKVIDKNGVGTYEDVACGIIYAADNNAKVINLSIGGYAYSFLLQTAIDYALEKGCILVASGGNDGIEQTIYPAGYPDVIGVSALGYNNEIWPLSNTGRHINVTAPGLNIISTGLENHYIYASGTSASASMVSALAAMLVSEKTDLSSSFIEILIIQSAKDLGEKGWDKIYGSGKIDAHTALNQKVRPFHDVAVRSVSIEPLAFEAEEKEILNKETRINYNNNLLSVSAENVHLRDLLLSISRKTNIDIDIQTNPNEIITIHFDNLPVRDALKKIVPNLAVVFIENPDTKEVEIVRVTAVSQGDTITTEQASTFKAVDKPADLSLKQLRDIVADGAEIRSLRVAAAKSLAKSNDPELVGIIDTIIQSTDDRNLSYGLVTALADLKSKDSINLLETIVKDHPNSTLRYKSVQSLIKIGDSGSLKVLKEAAQADPDQYTRAKAIIGLGELGDTNLIPELEQLSKIEKKPFVKNIYFQVIEKLTDQGEK